MLSSLAYYISVLRKDFTDYCNRQMSQERLTLGQIYFIIYVGKCPGCSPKELAEGLSMDAGHTARAIAKLVAGGFLLQRPNPDDRRAHLLQLTEAGEAAFQLAHELFFSWDEQALQPLSLQEREQLLLLIAKLLKPKGGKIGVREYFLPD